MNYKILFLFLIISNLILATSNMIEIKRYNINEEAKNRDGANLWKQYSFDIEERGKVRISIIANARRREKYEDDDLKWGIDNKDFGWGTPKSWDGNDLEGRSKKIVYENELEKGEHTLKFWADHSPMLEMILIEIDEGIYSQKPYINSIEVIENLGIKIQWNKVDSITNYGIYRKNYNNEYRHIAKINRTSYIDLVSNLEIKYTYKIATLSKNDKILKYSDEFSINNDRNREDNSNEMSNYKPPINISYTIKNNLINLNWDISLELKEPFLYKIYKKWKYEKQPKLYAITKNRFYKDNSIEYNKNHTYYITSYYKNGNESNFSKGIDIVVDKHIPKGEISIFPNNIHRGNTVSLYFNPFLEKDTNKEEDFKVSINFEESLFFNKEKQYKDMTFDKILNYWKFEFFVPFTAEVIQIKIKSKTGDYKKTYNFTIQNENIPPSPPKGLKTEVGNEYIKIIWEESEEQDVKEYEILKSDYPDKGFSDVKNVIGYGIENNFFVDKLVINDRRYYYKVRAVDYNGNRSELSSLVSAVPKKN